MRFVTFAPDPAEKYPDPWETPPIFVPELPSDIPEKTLEEQVAEREAQGEVVIDVVELGQEPDALPSTPGEEAEPQSPMLPLAAILGAAFLLL